MLRLLAIMLRISIVFTGAVLATEWFHNRRLTTRMQGLLVLGTMIMLLLLLMLGGCRGLLLLVVVSISIRSDCLDSDQGAA